MPGRAGGAYSSRHDPLIGLRRKGEREGEGRAGKEGEGERK